MTSAFSWQNSINLCPASFCTAKPNLPVTPGVSWLPTSAFQSPIMKRTSFWVLVLEGLVGLHRTIQLQLLQHYWLGHRLGLLRYWMVCLENEQRSFTTWCYMWSLKTTELIDTGNRSVVATGRGWGVSLMGSTVHRPQLQNKCQVDIIYSMVTVVNNGILQTLELLIM